MNLDLDAVSSWMRGTIEDFEAVEHAEKFSGGQSNPTYLLTARQRSFVLRRKPPGDLLKSAHAIDREYRVQSALRETNVPVARMIAYCADPEVIGSEFYVMEHVEGRCFQDPRLPHVRREDRHLFFNEMARVLPAIHKVDLARVGLEDYGRPGNYFRRQIDRWSRQYRATETGEVPDMDRLMASLDAACPDDDGRAALVHGDFRIDNLLFAPDEATIRAVLDWELSTIGHPYADLAAVVMQWRMPPGDEGRGLRGVDREAEGLPSDSDFVELYKENMGLRTIENFETCVAFCFFRMAAILQGVKKRALEGNASDPERGARLGELVPLYAAGGLEALDGRF